MHYLANSLFTMALVADLIMLMNLSLWQHTKAFMQSPEAKEYDRAMSEIRTETGLTPTSQSEVAGSAGGRIWGRSCIVWWLAHHSKMHDPWKHSQVEFRRRSLRGQHCNN